MNKQRNMIVKPLRVENNNRLINKIFPNGKKSEVQKEKNEKISGAPKSSNNLDEDLEYDDDASSVSSIESDCNELNIWDNSELRLRAINTQDFSDYYGKKLSFVQLYKIRSSFYTKGFVPQLSDVFNDAEKIHRFCQAELYLDDFLDEEARQNLIEIDYSKDRNFARFSRFFEQNLEFNSQKMREEQYDRYTCVQFQDGDILESESPAVQGRNSTYNRNGQRVISGLNLSPRKPPQKKKQVIDPQGQIGENLRKSKLNLGQLQEMQRKQKIQMSQQRLKQLSSQGQKVQFDLQKQSQSQIVDEEGQDIQSTTQESNSQFFNSNTFSLQECQQISNNNNPTNLISLKIASGTSQSNSPGQSPKSNGSIKRGSPVNQSMKSPINEQNEFRLKLKNTHENNDVLANSNKGNNHLRQISQTNQYSAMDARNDLQKVQGISSFNKFLSASSSPQKRGVTNSMNVSPMMNQSVKQNFDFNGLVKHHQQQNNSLLNSTQFKSFNSNNNQQQQTPSEYQLFNGKSNSNNNNEIKLPSITNLPKEKKLSNNSQESPLRLSQRFMQRQESMSSQSGSNLSLSPVKKPQAPHSSNYLTQHTPVVQKQNSYQRSQKKYQSTVFGEEQRKQFQQLLLSKQ